MKLKVACVTNYRCVEDSEEFTLDQVTCLVGKNESGKTTILQALAGLNPWTGEKQPFDLENDYPRRYLTEYAERHPDGDAIVIDTTWTLEQGDRDALKEVLGEHGGQIMEVGVSRGYKGTMYYSIATDEKKSRDHLIESSSLHAEERTALQSFSTVKDLKTAIENLGEAKTDRHDQILAIIRMKFGNESSFQAAMAVVAPRLPKFLLFSQYQRMMGEVSLDQVRARAQTPTPDDRIFTAFCDMVGMPIAEIAKLTQFEPTIARFEAASNRITKELFKYWTQNRYLKVIFRIDAGKPGDPAPLNSGNIVRTRIYNTAHEASVSFDDRSTGFVWFFSFLVLFSQVKKTHGDGLVVLLDEPGLSLHAKAQADLLRYFDERLAPTHQVVYTTHSPFMVSTENLMSARTVEDVIRDDGKGVLEVLGTKVGSDVLSTDRDTVFPLQGALGYEITQSLFIGKNTLLVEGPSDILFLKAMSEALKAQSRTHLSPKWTICPVGGIRKVGAFMSLFGGNNLHLAVLIDYVTGDKKQVDDLRKSKLLLDGHVLTADHYAGQTEADIEDILGSANYVALVNSCYSLAGPQLVPKMAATGQRVVKHVESHFKTLPSTAPEFDHFAPASHLFENAKTLVALPDIKPAMSRFEKLFHDINSLLPK